MAKRNDISNVEWSFCSTLGTDTDYATSTARFDTIEDAAEAAKEWLSISAENGFLPSVHLISFKKNNKAVSI